MKRKITLSLKLSKPLQQTGKCNKACQLTCCGNITCYSFISIYSFDKAVTFHCDSNEINPKKINVEIMIMRETDSIKSKKSNFPP